MVSFLMQFEKIHKIRETNLLTPPEIIGIRL